MQHIEVKIVDSIATVMLDRGEACHALNGQLIADLTQALSDVHQELKVSAVVLTAKGDHFCSGVDLKSFAEVSQLEPSDAQEAWFQTWTELTELCESLLRFPKPIIAAVDGPAIGAGLAIALAADLIVMSERATLQANAAQRGLIGAVTAPLLSFRGGGAIASRMLLTSEPMTATEAHRVGLCAEVVASDQIWVTANEWAKRCSSAPPESLQATKRILNETIGESLFTQLASAAATGATLCTTDSATEGVKAFVEKRLPHWPGRPS